MHVSIEDLLWLFMYQLGKYCGLLGEVKDLVFISSNQRRVKLEGVYSVTSTEIPLALQFYPYAVT